MAKDDNNQRMMLRRRQNTISQCQYQISRLDEPPVPLADPYPSSFEAPDLVLTSPHACTGPAVLQRSLLVSLDAPLCDQVEDFTMRA